jgi:hypothetical protein
VQAWGSNSDGVAAGGQAANGFVRVAVTAEVFGEEQIAGEEERFAPMGRSPEGTLWVWVAN